MKGVSLHPWPHWQRHASNPPNPQSRLSSCLPSMYSAPPPPPRVASLRLPDDARARRPSPAAPPPELRPFCTAAATLPRRGPATTPYHDVGFDANPDAAWCRSASPPRPPSARQIASAR
ncbi:hypothetical protein PVAP13_8NG133901 [Panicum virgatum]|uniref:Uncharacterized protein n=1 Tax=Panicum virgatum TaxID=38727 RepID=A0A8T0PAC2_PANVG|nr:hypothetical protein PVAP13_8NG133901 [Panicum virgatum]